MSSRFPKAHRLELAGEDEANIQRATRDATTGDDRIYHRHAVDNQRLRGIPAIGPGVTGATPGTIPGTNLR